MSVKDILEKVKIGEISIDNAEKLITRESFENLGFAKLDTSRKARTGFAEVVFCQGKSNEQLLNIYKKIFEIEGEVLGTRATKIQADFLKEHLGNICYDEQSKVLKIDSLNKLKTGNVVVCTAGTSDISVAEESAQVAEFFGTNVTRLYDVGVSGLHRLLLNVDKFENANCVIVVAGMEGALASVVGGLVSCPIIAVPTSIGYGANFNGLSALLTMINSCANGISVVNIDNGYGAGYIATQINRIANK